MNTQDLLYQKKSKCISSPGHNYFTHFAMRYPVMKRLILALIWHTLRIEFSNENIKFCSQCRLPLSFKSPMHMICSIVYFSLIFCWFFSFSILRNRYIWWFSKPSLKIRTANAICWIYLGVFRDLDNIFFWNKTFLFFKIES